MHAIFIAAAGVLGLPILLHLLLRQQPKRLVFPAMRFLKQRQRSSQRRVQLKHILLLLLRCLLLLLFAFALYQPTLSTAGVKTPFGSDPVAAVLIIDTSPSMGYRDGNTTRLDEARRRAADLLNELPANSKVAILTTHNPTGTWQPTVLEARQQLDAIRTPSGSAQSLGPALFTAYDLISQVDADNPEGSEPLPKLVAVFGDGTVGSWNPNEVSGLVAKRNGVPGAPPFHLFFNVNPPPPEKGPPPEPNNLSILDVSMESDRIAGAADAIVSVVVRSDGLAVRDLPVTAQLDDGPPEVKTLDLAPGGTVPAQFTFRRPPAGFHTVTVKLGRDDALPFDNERQFTFEVQAKRSILAISDRTEWVKFWQAAHNYGRQEFDCTVVTPDAVPTLAPFEMVAVIAVADPKPFAGKLVEYVNGGGKVLLAPDGPGSETDKNRATAYAVLTDILPAPLGAEVKSFAAVAKDAAGVAWKLDEEKDLQPRMLAPLRDWQKQGNVDVFKDPRKTAKYRPFGPNTAGVVAKYADPDRTAAVLERPVGKGFAVQLNTRLDDDTDDKDDYWNNFWVRDHSWPVVFPWLVTQYLCDLGTEVPGGTPGEKRRYNLPTGSAVPVPIRGFAPANGDRKLRLEGPGVLAGKSKFALPADATTLALRNKSRTDAVAPEPGEVRWELEDDPLFTAGTFGLLPDGVESPWRHRFTLSVPPGESDLQVVPDASIAELFGNDAVVRLDQKKTLEEFLNTRRNSLVELFPMLVLLVLIFFAVEGFLANRFYKLK